MAKWSQLFLSRSIATINNIRSKALKNFRDLQAARVAQSATETVFDPLNVMLVKCASCPWRKDGGVFHDDPESRLALQVSVINDKSQICHSAAFDGKTETKVCRGARDKQLQFFVGVGFLDEPTDEAWANKWLSVNNSHEHQQ
jgi:hypothetical protein